MDTGLGAKAYAIIEQGKIGLDPEHAPNRPPSAHRRSGRCHQVQVTPPFRGAEARGRAPEPDARRRHRLRGREAAGHAETAGRQGSKVSEAARASCGAGKRCSSRGSTVSWPKRSNRRADAWERHGSGRPRPRRVSPRSRPVWDGSGSSWSRRNRARPHRARARTRASWRSLASSSRSRSTASRYRPTNGRAAVVAAELETLEARQRAGTPGARGAPRGRGGGQRQTATVPAALAVDSNAYESAHREIEGLEADVEAARSEVFSAINSATALRHALEHAAAGSRDAWPKPDEARRRDRRRADRIGARVRRTARRPADGCGAPRTRSRRRASRAPRASRSWRARASSTSGARARCAPASRSSPALDARLKSLEELEAARAGYGDAARAVLAQANGKVGQQGAVADYLEVEAGYERAVEACLGDLLQHVVVDGPEHAAAGFQLVREQGAGRCGFVIAPGRPLTVRRVPASAGRRNRTPMASSRCRRSCT